MATLGVIVGNRGFFPAHLCESGRKTILQVLADENIDCITMPVDQTKFGAIESHADARKCADLFKQHAGKIDGILVTLPNFGDERAVANSIRWSGLNVPVLVHAFEDDGEKMTIKDRRDSFCGKISICNNLGQYGIPFTLTSSHTMDPEGKAFRKDLKKFVGTCRVVKGLQGMRIGMLGARPTAFNTVRFSEKLLEASGISVDTLDLSEAIGRANRIKVDEPSYKAKLEEIKNYAVTNGVPPTALERMARLGVVIDRWMADDDLNATAVQCWTAIEQFYGITPCTLMSMLSNKLLPSACETDVTGVISMAAMSLASGRPSALLDWNNNYGDEEDKCVVFHCSNLPAAVFEEKPVITYSDIFANDVGKENAYGTVSGKIKPQPFTFCRVSTNDLNGTIMAYVGEGRFTDDPIDTFGGYGVAEVPGLQDLLKFMCNNLFEHHVAVNASEVSDAVAEAFGKYMGWEVFRA